MCDDGMNVFVIITDSTYIPCYLLQVLTMRRSRELFRLGSLILRRRAFSTGAEKGENVSARAARREKWKATHGQAATGVASEEAAAAKGQVRYVCLFQQDCLGR